MTEAEVFIFLKINEFLKVPRQVANDIISEYLFVSRLNEYSGISDRNKHGFRIFYKSYQM